MCPGHQPTLLTDPVRVTSGPIGEADRPQHQEVNMSTLTALLRYAIILAHTLILGIAFNCLMTQFPINKVSTSFLTLAHKIPEDFLETQENVAPER